MNPIRTAAEHDSVRNNEVDATAVAIEQAAEQTCDVCAHIAAGHDPISRRYCAATLANALSRNCICV